MTKQQESKPDLAKLREPFDPAEYEWKIQSCGQANSGKFWALIVPYIQSRALMSRLDDVVGFENWRAEYLPSPIGDGIECRLFIRVNGEWIEKRDGAEIEARKESGFATKANYSNSFKRACVVAGCGRELYEISSVWADTSPQKQDGWTRATTPKKQGGKQFWWRVPDKWLGGIAVEHEAEEEAGPPESPQAKLAYQLTPDERERAELWLSMEDCDELKIGKEKTRADMLLKYFLEEGASSRKVVEIVFAHCRKRWPEGPPRADDSGGVDITDDDIPF